jgi:hypothetical protein
MRVQLYRHAIWASALLLAVETSAYARGLSPLTDEGAAAAGLIQFYSQRCGREPGYSLTSRALAFIDNAASGNPAMFYRGYATEAHMPTQNCTGAYDYNLGPRGVVSSAIGFTIMLPAGRAAPQ